MNKARIITYIQTASLQHDTTDDYILDINIYIYIYIYTSFVRKGYSQLILYFGWRLLILYFGCRLDIEIFIYVTTSVYHIRRIYDLNYA